MMIRHLILTGIFKLLIANLTYSQKIDNISICDVYHITGKKDVQHKLDSLIKRDDVYGKAAIAKFRMLKAQVLYFKNQYKISIFHKSYDKETEKLILEMKDQYELAEKDINVEDKLELSMWRYEALGENKIDYINHEKDYELLKNAHFKESKKSLGLSIITKYNKDLWLGGELSLIRWQEFKNTVEEKNHTMINGKTDFIASVLSFSYLRNLSKDQSDFNFSVLKTQSPYYIDIMKFGFISFDKSYNWYYRPELGYAFNQVSISYSYNTFFKNKLNPTLFPKHSISVAFHHTF